MTKEQSEKNPVPTVSIIMGAYNAASTIREALESILAQTFTDWEFIICDDNSSDSTLQICREYAAANPGRFRVLANERNMKLPATLNRCLSAARGKFIARMDADDLSTPTRLATQVAFLESHPDIHLVGSSMQRFDDSGLGSLVLPVERPDRNTLRRRVPFCHATILARREVYEQLGGYNESTRTSRGQDVDLWFNFYRLEMVGFNLLEPLYMVREDAAAIRRRTAKVRWNSFLTMVNGYRMLGYPIRWYVRPVLELSKVLVPFRAQQWYRRWQARRAEAGIA
ncbi:glycosyltransferase family 2 protein [Microbacterium alcoholitolerans]|uniref:glycosyltransferase family 2 protein n=1 Tax=unclassified Microbacterium TaxID=2609290 RepID=UPI003D187263